ncbi:MAG: hypothetical protein RL378_521, partial [Actinomycetota bacterium]
ENGNGYPRFPSLCEADEPLGHTRLFGDKRHRKTLSLARRTEFGPDVFHSGAVLVAEGHAPIVSHRWQRTDPPKSS